VSEVPAAAGRPPTIKDVAREAGVSWKTVSNVIHERVNVLPDTRERVLDAIAKLGYRPNFAGRQLRASRTKLLALAFPEVANPYFAELAHRMILASRELGYTALVDELLGDPAREESMARGFSLGAMDGIVLSPQVIVDLESIEHLRAHTPMVLLGEHVVASVSDAYPIDIVRIDNERAAMEATSGLIAAGRRRIGFAGASFDEPGTGGVRRAGYLAALAQAKIAEEPRWIFGLTSYSRAAGAALLRDNLDVVRELDALLCVNDLVAHGFIHAATEAGLRVPEDLAVVGWDDNEEGRYSHPTLTTVSPDKDAIARRTIETLVARIDGDDAPASVTIVPHRLVVRESTGPLG